MSGLVAIPGAGPIVLVAPHGARRDPGRRPSSGRRLRVNDLHTVALTTELARLLDAPALVNASLDRNDTDLNRVSEAAARAPWFLDALADVLSRTIARHGRATLLAVHGWNVIEPVVDLGLGCAPSSGPSLVDATAAVSPAFAATAVRGLIAACAARDIVATPGLRYPARHRQNLLQLFTARYRDDPRPPVRAVAAHASQVDAVQMELGIPLRWPGTWRDRLLDACVAARSVLAGTAAAPSPSDFPQDAGAGHASAIRLQFTGTSLCGLVATDDGGGRLLLFPPAGGLVLFTGERAARGRPMRLAVTPTAGGVTVRFRGPLLHFPDTTPFLDLEPGLAHARLVEADVALDFAADDAASPGAFGRVEGRAMLDGTPFVAAGGGFAEAGSGPALWPRFRTALRLDGGADLLVTAGPTGAGAQGFLRRDGHDDPVVAAGVTLGPADAPLAHAELDVALASGARVALSARALHRLPVVRHGAGTPIRLEYAACRLDGGGPTAAGWAEVGGL